MDRLNLVLVTLEGVDVVAGEGEGGGDQLYNIRDRAAPVDV